MSLPSKPDIKRIRWFGTSITTSRYYAITSRLLKPSGVASSIRATLPHPSSSYHFTEATYLAINEIIGIPGVDEVQVYQYGLFVRIGLAFDWTEEGIHDSVVGVLKKRIFPASSDVEVQNGGALRETPI